MNGIPAPAIVRIVAALLIVSGAAAVVHMIHSAWRGDFSIDFAFIGIPVGRGLLRGSETSRWWAIRLSVITFFLILAVVAWVEFKGGFRGTSFLPISALGIYTALMAVTCVVMFFGMRSASARAWFQADPANQIRCGEWTTPLLVVGALVGLSAVIGQAMMEASYRDLETSVNGMYSFRTRFECRDAKTQEFVTTSVSQGGISLSQHDVLRPRMAISMSREGNGNLKWELSGFAGRPFEVTFAADGYQPFVYRFTDRSPSSEVLVLQRK